MLYILYGPDDFSIARELDAIKHSAGDPAMLATNTLTLDGAQVPLDELRVACETVPFLADKRLVIVYGLLARFMPRPASRGSAPRRAEAPPPNPEPFAALINGIPPSTILVLIETELRDYNPLLKLISRSATVKAYPLMKPQDLRLWVARQVTEEGSSISPTAVSLLVRLIGSNLWIMSSELKKLITYAGGRGIDEKAVTELVGYTQQVNVFAMVDAIVDFNLERAETMLQQLLNDGATPAYLLAMLNRQMRLIVRARELKAQKLNDAEIKSRLGQTSDFVVRKTLDQASRYTLPRLRQVYQALLDTDIAIKTGKYDGELALNILVADLCQSQSPTPPHPRAQGVKV